MTSGGSRRGADRMILLGKSGVDLNIGSLNSSYTPLFSLLHFSYVFNYSSLLSSLLLASAMGITASAFGAVVASLALPALMVASSSIGF